MVGPVNWMEANIIYLYTDGSVTQPMKGHSPGGWAFSYSIGDKVVYGSGGCLDVTNNQMEMMGVIKGLQALLLAGQVGKAVCIVSDSQYVIYGSSQWIIDWKRRNWRDRRGRVMKNKKYWIQIDDLAVQFKTKWKWIRGHKGHPINEACDKLARAAAFRSLSIAEAAS